MEMNKRELSFWDVIAWIVLAGILLWLILKTFGIISSPLWVEYAPIYGAVYLVGWQIHKLAVVAKEVEGLKRFKEATINEINRIKGNCIKNHNK